MQTCSTDGVFLWAHNEMSADTAFGVLHLLDHLRNTYVSWHYSSIFHGADTGSSMVLNPSIIRLLSKEKEDDGA